MYRLLKPQFDLRPSVEFNGIPLNGVKRALLLIISTKYEDDSIKRYDASTVSLLAHRIDTLPRILLDAVSLALGQVIFSIITSKNIKLTVRDAKY